MDRVGGVREPNAFRGGGIVARSNASGGEGEEISIDNMGDWYSGMVKVFWWMQRHGRHDDM